MKKTEEVADGLFKLLNTEDNPVDHIGYMLTDIEKGIYAYHIYYKDGKVDTYKMFVGSDNLSMPRKHTLDC